MFEDPCFSRRQDDGSLSLKYFLCNSVRLIHGFAVRILTRKFPQGFLSQLQSHSPGSNHRQSFCVSSTYRVRLHVPKIILSGNRKPAAHSNTGSARDWIIARALTCFVVHVNHALYFMAHRLVLVSPLEYITMYLSYGYNIVLGGLSSNFLRKSISLKRKPEPSVGLAIANPAQTSAHGALLHTFVSPFL